MVSRELGVLGAPQDLCFSVFARLALEDILSIELSCTDPSLWSQDHLGQGVSGEVARCWGWVGRNGCVEGSCMEVKWTK